jgi:hypothetical protein
MRIVFEKCFTFLIIQYLNRKLKLFITLLQISSDVSAQTCFILSLNEDIFRNSPQYFLKKLCLSKSPTKNSHKDSGLGNRGPIFCLLFRRQRIFSIISEYFSLYEVLHKDLVIKTISNFIT